MGVSWLMAQDGDFGLRRDTNQSGLGLNADTHPKKRREFAGPFGQGDNGGTLADPDNAARLAVKADEIASAEAEWIKGLHLECGEVNKRGCADSAARRARSASARSRVIRSPSSVSSVKRLKACRVNKNSCCGIGKRRLLRFMVGAPSRLVRRVKGGILVARVYPSAGAILTARVLPNLPPPVPMESKLRQLRRHVARLLLLKLNPNPLADNLAQFPKARGLAVEHVNNLRCGKSPVLETESEINPMQLF
jgi:hypothetical protein